MKKRIVLILLVVFVILLVVGTFFVTQTNLFGAKATKLQQVTGITVVPTMRDAITSDSSWCGTFQLVWNDMKNEVVKKDIEFTPQEEMVVNLNQEDFTEDMISEEYYYKTYGLKTLALKEEIENGIREKSRK